jgi:hypothetical protein
VIVQKASASTSYTMAGASDYSQARIQIDSYAETYRQAKLGMRRIRSSISGRRVGIFMGIFAQTERDLTDNNSVETQATRLYRISQDFMVHHTGD